MFFNLFKRNRSKGLSNTLQELEIAKESWEVTEMEARANIELLNKKIQYYKDKVATVTAETPVKAKPDVEVLPGLSDLSKPPARI